MTIGFTEFIVQLWNNPALLITVILTLGVILVNGWTDAPNAIATCISTRAISPKAAILMAAVFNFLGVLFMTAINATVAETIYNMVDFRGNTHEALVALCAALFAIVTWATAAWAFGIPTSESHALIAGLSGSAIALHNGLSGINGEEWIKVIYGLVLSTLLGFAMGWICVKLTGLICRRMDRRRTTGFFGKAQIAGGAAMAFMHGAQDGQKFIGVFLIAAMLKDGTEAGATVNLRGHLGTVVLCALVMAAGTMMGGKRIIKSVGFGITPLRQYEGFCADLASVCSLFVSTFLGLPVSTTHVKTMAVVAVGFSDKAKRVELHTVRQMALAWAVTFPVCTAFGYLLAGITLRWLF